MQHRDKVQRVHKFVCISYLDNIGDNLGESNIKKFCERNDGDFNPPPLFDCIVDVVEVSGKSVWFRCSSIHSFRALYTIIHMHAENTKSEKRKLCQSFIRKKEIDRQVQSNKTYSLSVSYITLTYSPR